MRRFKPLRLAWMGLAFAISALLCAPDAAAQEKPRHGGHLRVGLTLEPTSLDPMAGRSGGDAFYWRQMFDELIDADQKGNPDPAISLATSWEIAESPPAIVFALRQGVKFCDGTAFDADAVKRNIDRILDPASKATPRAGLLAIKSVDVLDDHTVRLNLTGPWAAGFGLLADRGGAMSSPTAFTKLMQDYGWSPCGTGPFTIKDVVTGSSVHLVRNENYWGRDKDGNKLPYLDEITFKVIKDETVLASALRAGEIDIAYLPNRSVNDFLADPNFHIERMDGGSVASVLVFNPDVPPMDDINLRRAVAYAVNPADINKAALFGKGVVADSGLWPVNTWVHEPSKVRLAYNLQSAREALAAGGKPNGFELNIVTWNLPSHQQTAEIVRAQLGRVGIKANIEVLTVGPATEKFFAAKANPVFLTSWSRYPEPDVIASLDYKSGGYYNASKRVNKEIDDLIVEGAATYDQAKRKEIYNRLNDIELGQVLWDPLVYAVAYVAAPKKVQNMDLLLAADGKLILKYIWIRQ